MRRHLAMTKKIFFFFEAAAAMKIQKKKIFFQGGDGKLNLFFFNLIKLI
jgi:hypothetical protein